LQLLLAPVHAYSHNLLDVISFPSSSTQPERKSPYLAGNYTELLFLQQFPTRRKVAHEVADTLVKNQTLLSSPMAVQLVFGELCQSMVLDQRDGGLFGEVLPDGSLPLPGKGPLDWEDVEQEQSSVAKLVHLSRYIKEDEEDDMDPVQADQTLQQTVRRHLAAGGEIRMRWTLPALAMETLRLSHHVAPEDLANVFKFLFETITALDECEGDEFKNGLGNPHDVAFRLALQAAVGASAVGQSDVAFDLFVEVSFQRQSTNA
jgi:vacuolar protein sorting-associated protein 35